MASQTIVDRQATFDTDPLSSHIQKGKLKLPVIGSNKPELSTISDKSVRLTETNTSTEKKEVKGKQGKQESPRIVVKESGTKGRAGGDTGKVIDKSKNTGKPNASQHLEATKAAAQPSVDKSSVLKGLNAKRAKSPVTEQKEVKNIQTKGDIDTQKTSNDNVGKVAQGKSQVVRKQEPVNKPIQKQGNQKPPDKDSDKGVTVKPSNNKDTSTKQTTNAQNVSKVSNSVNNTRKDKEDKHNAETKPIGKQNAQSVQINKPGKLAAPVVNSDNDTHRNKAAALKGINAKNSSSPVQTSVVTLKKDHQVSKAQNALILSSDKPAENKSKTSKRSLSPEKHPEKSKHDTKNVSSTNKSHQAQPSVDFTSKKETGDSKSEKKQIQSKKETLPANTAPVKTSLDKQQRVVKNDKTTTDNTPNPQINKNNASGGTSPRKVDAKKDKPVKLPTEVVSQQKKVSLNVKPADDAVDRNDTGITYVISDQSKADLKQRPVISTPRETIKEEEEIDEKSDHIVQSSPRKMDLRRETYEQVYGERNTLLNAELAYKERIKQLEDEANSFLKTIEDLTAENKDLRRRLDRIEGNGERSDDRADTKNESSDDETRELKAQIITLQSENQSLNEENVKMKADHYENLKKLHSLEGEVKESARGTDKSKHHDSANENEQLMKEMKQLRDKNTQLETKVKTLAFENKGLSETLTQKKDELGELLGVMKDENKFDGEIRELNNRVIKLTKEKQEMEQNHTKEKRVLSEDLKESNTKLVDIMKQMDEVKVHSLEMEAENKTLSKENNKLKTQVSTQNDEIISLKREIAELKAMLKDGNLKYDTLLSETESANSDLKGTKDELEKFNKELKSVVSEKELQISKLIAQLDTIRQEKDTERKNHKNYQETSTAEIERLKVFEKSLAHKESELRHYIERNEDSDRKRQQLDVQLEDKGFQISNLEQQIFESNMKLESSSQRISQLDKDKRDMENDKREWEVKRDKFNDIESSNKRLLEENRRLRNQFESGAVPQSHSHSHGSSQKQDHSTETTKPLKEAWSVAPTHPPIHAAHVPKDKKRIQINISTAHRGANKQKIPQVKISPGKANHKTHSTYVVTRTEANSSRSMEDLRRTPVKSPESEHSLPELRHHSGGVTYHGGLLGYAQIHKDRIRAHKRRV